MYICISVYIYIYIYMHTYIHYITLHYITLHYITLHTYIHTLLRVMSRTFDAPRVFSPIKQHTTNCPRLSKPTKPERQH